MKGLTLLIYFLSLVGRRCDGLTSDEALQSGFLLRSDDLWEREVSLRIQELMKDLFSGPLRGQRATVIIPEDIGSYADGFLDLPEAAISVLSLPKKKPETLNVTLDKADIISHDVAGQDFQNMGFGDDGTMVPDKYTSVAITLVSSQDVNWWPLWLPVRHWSSGAALLVSIDAPCRRDDFMQVPFMQAAWAAFICPRVPQGEFYTQPKYQVWTNLPFAAHNKSISLGIWRPEAFPLWSDLFIDRYQDMSDKLMTVLGFGIDVPLLYAYTDYGQAKGLCFMIFRALAEWLGFSYRVDLTRDTSFHEIEDTVIRGKNDMFLNFASLTPYRYNEFSLTVPYHYEGFGLILEVPPPLPQWQNVIYPFTWQVWVATMVTLFLTALTFHLLHHKQERSFITNFITVGQGLLSNPMAIVPDDLRTRYFLLLWWILSWLLELSYLCNLIAVLTIPAFPKKIQTAKELADSNYRVCMLNYGEFVVEAMPASDHPVLAALGAKMDLVPVLEHLENAGEEGCVELVLEGTHAHLETYSYIIYLYNKLGHNARIYPMKEELYQAYLAFPVQKDAPWKYKFDEGMQRLFEGGLIKRWTREAMEEALGGARSVVSVSLSEAHSLTVSHLQGPFLILVLGNLFAAVVVLGEILIGMQKKNSD